MVAKKPDPVQSLAPFLKSLYLFSGLDDERIARLALEFERVSFVEGEQIYAEGDQATDFFLVYDGKVNLRMGRGRQRRDWDTLSPGDFFGEDLLLGPTRSDTAIATLPSELLRMDKERFNALLEELARLNEMVRAAAVSRRLARRQGMKWLGPDEAIYFIGRKHEFFLLVRLILPILLGILAIPVLSIGIGSSSVPFILVAGVMALLTGAIGVWIWEDWRNDYYIVTSQRVLWLEKVVLLYDSRQEAPLVTVISKNVVFNQVLRRFIDYGTVIVRTFTGSIVMRRANQPDLLVAFIDALQTRARQLVRKSEEAKMEELIRERLNMPPKQKPVMVPAPAIPPPDQQAKPRRGPLEQFFTNFFKMRYEDGNTITYRKHWFVLLQKTFWPGLVFVAVLALILFLGISGMVSTLVGIALGVLTLPAIAIWWLYQYVDWRNDIYVVTLDSILDIERKPLSREEKRSAPLENILSLEHTRVGILGLLLNFGTVIINIGTEKFDFYGVYNPAEVQYEIFDRMLALRQRKEEAGARKERERIVEMLTAYHKQVDTSEVEENDSDWEIF